MMLRSGRSVWLQQGHSQRNISAVWGFLISSGVFTLIFPVVYVFSIFYSRNPETSPKYAHVLEQYLRMRMRRLVLTIEESKHWSTASLIRRPDQQIDMYMDSGLLLYSAFIPGRIASN